MANVRGRDDIKKEKMEEGREGCEEGQGMEGERKMMIKALKEEGAGGLRDTKTWGDGKERREGEKNVKERKETIKYCGVPEEKREREEREKGGSGKRWRGG